MSIQIERDVPLPGKRLGGATYPWAEMAVGDSFAAGIDKSTSLRTGATLQGKRLGKKFICRLHGEGVRVWRTA